MNFLGSKWVLYCVGKSLKFHGGSTFTFLVYMATYLSSMSIWPANVLGDALDLPRWMDQNFCQSALRMGWNYDLLPWLLMVTNRATNEPEVVLILWSLSAVLSERSEH